MYRLHSDKNTVVGSNPKHEKLLQTYCCTGIYSLCPPSPCHDICSKKLNNLSEKALTLFAS